MPEVIKEDELVSASGGRRQKIGERWDLIPYEGLVAVAEVFDYGATKYEDDNWKKINFSHSEQAPVNHAIAHAYKALTEPFGSDRRRWQLAKAATNLLMQLWGESETVTLDASKITAGVLSAAAIETLDVDAPSILDKLKAAAGIPSIHAANVQRLPDADA
jgi:hypothetical protein